MWFGATLLRGCPAVRPAIADGGEKRRRHDPGPCDLRRCRAIDQAGDGIFIQDLDGRFTDINEMGCRLLGYSRASILGRTAQELFGAGCPLQGAEGYRDRPAGGIVCREWEYVTDTGSFCLEIVSRAAAEGFIVSTVRDISGRKCSERALSRSQRFLSGAQSVARIGCYVLDVETGSWEGSAVLDEILGVSNSDPHDFEGWLNLVAEDQRDELGRYYHERRRTGSRFEKEYRIVRPSDGVTRWVLGLGEFETTRDGVIVAMIGTIQDVTERKLGEEAAHRSQQMLQLVMNNIPLGVFWKNLDSTYLGCNKAFAADAGLAVPDLVIGMRDEQMPWSRDAGRFRVDDQEIMERDLARFHVEEQRLTSSGAVVWLKTCKIALHDLNGKVFGILGTCEDITESKRVAEQLTKARDEALASTRAKSEFLANMSHELRTPLNGIIGMTELVLDSELTVEQRNYLSLSRKSADLLLGLLNSLLDLSRLEARKMEVSRVTFSLHEALETTVRSLAIQAQLKGLQFDWLVAPDVPGTLCGDAARICQVVTNLAGNAIKFTDHGRVTVSVSALGTDYRERLLRFTVSDTGIGIPESKLEGLFEPFYQVDGSATRRFGGSGLGLAISKQLVELMGGRIWIDRSPASGSVFYFEVPVEVVCDDTRLTCHGPLERALVSGLNVAEVDSIGNMLSLWGYETESCTPGEMAAVCATRRLEGRGLALVVAADAQVGELPCGEDLEGALLVSVADPAVPALGDVTVTRPITMRSLMECVHRAQGCSGDELRHGAARSGATVLLAEDNEVNLVYVETTLSRRGYRVRVARDGAEALKLLAAEKVDLALVDIEMPVKNGLQVMAELRAGAAGELNRHVPVVVLTAHAMSDDRERCLACGANGYLAKPVSVSELLECVAGQCSGSATAARQAATIGSGGALEHGAAGFSGEIAAARGGCAGRNADVVAAALDGLKAAAACFSDLQAEILARAEASLHNGDWRGVEIALLALEASLGEGGA